MAPGHSTDTESLVEDSSNNEPYAAEPVPSYLEETGQLYRGSKIQDMSYHLLSLYTDRTHALHALLDPSTVTPNTLDYRLR